MNAMLSVPLCGAFSIPTRSPKSNRSHAAASAGEDTATVFTFQLSPGGSRGSFIPVKLPGIIDSGSFRSARSDRCSKSDNSLCDHNRSSTGRSRSSSRRRGHAHSVTVQEYRDMRKALFDAATESESMATDPLLGKAVVVSTPEKNEIDAASPDKRQLLWHAALQYHKSRHGRDKEHKSKQQTRHNRHKKKRSNKKKSSKESSQHQHTVLSKDSFKSNIRKRSLKNIQLYLPSLSESINTKHGIQKTEEYCPHCSCRLTYLYSSVNTRRLTEIHSGCDTPTSKRKYALPPYCIGCRGYLVYEDWDETYRRLVLRNFEKRIEFTDDNDSNGGSQSYPLEDFKNGRLIVVAKDGCSCYDRETPRISNSSSSEVSGLSRESHAYNEEVEEGIVALDGTTTSSLTNSFQPKLTIPDPDDAENEKNRLLSITATTATRTKLPEHYDANGGLLTPTSPYRRKGMVMFHSSSESASVPKNDDAVDNRKDGETKTLNQCKGKVIAAVDVRDECSEELSENDPIVDLMSPMNGKVQKTTQFAGNESLREVQTNKNPADDNDRDNIDVAPMTKEEYEKCRHETPIQLRQTTNHENRSSCKVIDEAITFKSPSLTAKKHLEEAHLAVTSTFSEEFAIFQNYSVKKAAATKQIAKCLHKGYELTLIKCDRCEMPLMKRGNEEAVCVSCPAIMKKVRRIVKEKRNELKTPRISNRMDFGSDSVYQLDTRDDEEERNFVGIQLNNNETGVNEQEETSFRESAPSIPADGHHLHNFTVEEIDKLEQGAASENHTIPFGHSDYWVAHSASQTSNAQQVVPGSSLFPEPSSQYIHHDNEVSFADNNYHYNQQSQTAFCQEDNHRQQQQQQQQTYFTNKKSEDIAHESSQHHSEVDTKEFHQHTPAFYQNDYHHNQEQQQDGVRTQEFHQYTGRPSQSPHPKNSYQLHYNANRSQPQSIQQQSSYENYMVNESQHQQTQQQPTCQLNSSSIESNQGSFHNIANGESIESATKCPRDLPSTGLIWDYRPSEKSHLDEGRWHRKPNRNNSSDDSRNIHPAQASDKEGFVHPTAMPHGEALKPFDSYNTAIPVRDRVKDIWNECVPVSLEMNSRAKLQAENREFVSEQSKRETAEICHKPNNRDCMISPSTLATTATNLSVHEEQFCERLKEIANSLKRTAEEFGLGDNDNSARLQYNIPSLSGDHPLPYLPTAQDMSEKGVEMKPIYQHQSTSPIVLRKPLEPAGIVSHKRQSMEPEIVHANIETNTYTEVRELVSSKRSDPPGSSPPDENACRRTAAMSGIQTSRILYAHKGQNIVSDPITPIRLMADPPEIHLLSSNKWHNITTPQRKNGTRMHSSRNSIRTPFNATPQMKKVAQVHSPRRKVRSPTKGAHRERISPGSTMSLTKSSRAHTPISKTKTISNQSQPGISRHTEYNGNAPIESAFHLKIPSWVDNEIDTPMTIKSANSFGETSMEQLMRKIDEIENDFSTVVASLPGSDGLSLNFTYSDDNSTLASKATFDMREDGPAEKLASKSFESKECQEKLMSGIMHQMKLVQDQINHLDSADMDDESKGSQESQGMAELLERLAHAAESLRSFQVE